MKKLSILPQQGPKITTSDRSARQLGQGDGKGILLFVLEFVFLASMCHKGLHGGGSDSSAEIERIDDNKEAPRKTSGRYGLISPIPT
ncbi:MAG: hypothetical protein SXA11_05360 [Cyanobacteriota bacterium]|nr:hypothetical protein [Cyanobacteriota bacterium]